MRVTINLGSTGSNCFVIMPFSPKFDLIYVEVFKPAIEAAGLSAIRADEIYGTKRIMQDIWDSIRGARIVLAELSGRSPNVLYELGLSHAIGKPVVIVTSSMDDVPFDLKDLRCIVYEKDHPRWGEALKQSITQSLRSVVSEYRGNLLLSDIIIEGTYPELPKDPITPRRTQLEVNLTGQWQGKEQLTNRNFERDTSFYIIQQEQNVTGIALIQRPSDRSPIPLVVKQTVSGRVDGLVMNLVATSYEVVSGDAENWSLESWQATIDEEGNQMSGMVSDGHNNQGKFVLQRVKEPHSNDGAA